MRRKTGKSSKTSSARGSGKSRGSGKGKKWYSGNILMVMLLRLLVALLLLFLSRILFYLFNVGYFAELKIMEALRIFMIGLRFDLSALLILNFPFILMNSVPFKFRYNRVYQGFANGYFYVINALALMVNFGDTIYFRFTLKRLTADFFNYLGVGGDFDRLIPQFLSDFWYVMLTWLLFVAILIYLGTRFTLSAPGAKKRGLDVRYLIVHAVLFVIIGILSVIGIRGGLQLRPIGLVTAGGFTTAKNVPLLLNTPFSIARTVGHETLKSITFFKKEADLARVYTPVHAGKTDGFKKLNVMIIIMESFSREHIGILNHSLENGRYQGFTSFMDSLIRNGFYFDAFANGKTSIQGIPAILSGIPSLMNESFIQSNYATGKFSSIASMLKPKGYTSAFFHGGTNGTMGFDNYTKMTGFDHYFGRTEYGNEKDYDGKWGIRDEEFMQFTARQLDKLKSPFVATFFSLSSHHPYFVPGKYTHVFRNGKLPIQKSIMYADHALGEFFHAIQRQPWFKNTLFVITADHTSEGYYPYYKSNVGQYAIPLLFYMPESNLKGMSQVIAQQTDILPTVLNFLGYDQDFIAFGEDLFDLKAPHFSIHYISGVYGLIKDGSYLEFDGTTSTQLFDLKRDPLQLRNVISSEKAMKEKMELFMKAVIQQYNNRVIENRLTVD